MNSAKKNGKNWIIGLIAVVMALPILIELFNVDFFIQYHKAYRDFMWKVWMILLVLFTVPYPFIGIPLICNVKKYYPDTKEAKTLFCLWTPITFFTVKNKISKTDVGMYRAAVIMRILAIASPSLILYAFIYLLV